MVDSGASTNVIDVAPYQKIVNSTPLKPTSIRLYPYGSNKELPIHGQISAAVKLNDAETRASFYISVVGITSLLSYDTA